MSPDDLEAYARALAAQHGLDPDFVAAIGHAESGFKPDAVSKAGAMGPMQLMPATAKDLGVNPADPYDNVRGGVQYLAKLNDQFGGDPALVAAAYNAGPGAVQKAGGVPNFPETQAYVAKVTKPVAIDPTKVQWDSPPAIDPSKVQWNPPATEGRGEAALVGLGSGLDSLAAGLRSAVPAPVRNVVDKANDFLSQYDLTGPNPSIDPQVRAQQQAALKPLENKYPLTMAATESAPMLAAPTPLTMGALAALNYAPTLGDRATNGAIGFAGGKVGELLGAGLSRLVQPIRAAGNDAVDATKALFDKYGMQGLPGQVTGSKPLQMMESVVANLPGGGRVRDAMAAQQTGLNRAAMGAIGGAGDAVTPEAVEAARQAVGSTIGNVTKPITVATDDTLLNSLGAVEQKYGNRLDALQKPVVQNLIDQISSMPSMSGEFYQSTRSDIAKMARGASGAYQDALTGIYKSLDRAFDRSAAGTDAAAQVAAARSQYATGKTIGKMATETGDISAARLANAAKNLPPSARDLSALGSRMKPLPNSTTAERLAYQGLLGAAVGTAQGLRTGDVSQGLEAAGGSFAAPWLLSQALTRAPIRNYLMNTLISPATHETLRYLGHLGGGLLALPNTR